MATIDEAKLVAVRALTSTTWGWNGDWQALFDLYSIPAGQFEARMLAWANLKAGSGFTNLPDALNAVAAQQGAASWAQLGTFTPTPYLAGATMDMNFAGSQYLLQNAASLSVTRATPAATYAKNAAGAWVSFAANTARITDLGLLIEEARNQYLGVTGTPATQTTGAIPTGSLTLWVEGTGTATVTAGTATISAPGTATPGSPYTFTCSVGGTVVVTVAGSVSFFQLENGAFATSKIDNAGAAGSTVTRATDVVKLTAGNFSGWWATTGTLYGDGSPVDNVAGAGTRRLLEVNDATANNRLLLGLKNGVGTTNARALCTTAAVAQYDLISAATYQGGQPMKIAAAFAASNDAQMAANGTLATTASAAETMPTVTQACLGADNGGANVINGVLRRIAFIPSRSSASLLTALTPQPLV